MTKGSSVITEIELVALPTVFLTLAISVPLLLVPVQFVASVVTVWLNQERSVIIRMALVVQTDAKSMWGSTVEDLVLFAPGKILLVATASLRLLSPVMTAIESMETAVLSTALLRGTILVVESSERLPSARKQLLETKCAETELLKEVSNATTETR